MSGSTGTALLGGTLALCALLFALPALYVPGVALLVLGLVAGGWVGGAAKRARVRCEVGRRTAVEGESVCLSVRATLGPLPSPGGALVAAGADSRIATGARGVVELRREIPLERRGRHALGPVRLELSDPLGIASRAIHAGRCEVLVLPRTEPVATAGGGSRTGTIPHAGRGGGPETELESLRPYRPGAPASRIHWPTVARARELVERSFEAESDTLPLVVLDSRAPGGHDALDRAVRAAASLTLALARAGGCRLALPGDRLLEVPDLRAWPAAHARLALVQPAPARARLHPPAGGVAYWVTGRPHRSGPPAAGSFRELLLVAPGDAGPGALFSVAGCVGVRSRTEVRRAA